MEIRTKRLVILTLKNICTMTAAFVAVMVAITSAIVFVAYVSYTFGPVVTAFGGIGISLIVAVIIMAYNKAKTDLDRIEKHEEHVMNTLREDYYYPPNKMTGSSGIV